MCRASKDGARTLLSASFGADDDRFATPTPPLNKRQCSRFLAQAGRSVRTPSTYPELTLL